MNRFRVLSFNMRKGLGAHGRGDRFHLHALVEALRHEEPHLIFLQEVYYPHRKDFLGMADRIAEALEMSLAYTPNSQYESGHHGNATLSRWPILSMENYDLSMRRFERRGALYTSLAAEGGTMHAINTHFGLNHRQRRAQVLMLAAIIRALVPGGEPLVLAGDMNDWHGMLRRSIREYWPLKDALGGLRRAARRTWHTRLPLFALDRVYYAGLELERAYVERAPVWRQLSDHFPVIGEFRRSVVLLPEASTPAMPRERAAAG